MPMAVMASRGKQAGPELVSAGSSYLTLNFLLISHERLSPGLHLRPILVSTDKHAAARKKRKQTKEN